MKKSLLTTLIAGLTLASVRADLIWNETFNYPNGPIIATGTNSDGSTNWFRHSGSTIPSDSIVSNSKLQVSTSGSGFLAPARTDDVNRKLATVPDSPYTNGPILLYASLTVNFTNLPTANGTYFAHFQTDSSHFYGRLFALTGNPNGTSNVFSALPGTYRLGISAANGTLPSKIFPVDLALNTDYQVVVGYDPVSLNDATIWVNPLSASDFSLTSNDALTAPPAALAYGFRQASGFGGFLTVSNLAVATTFDEAATNIWSTNAVAPVIAYQPKGGTNFVGNPAMLSVVAAGQSLANLTYEWRKDGSTFVNPAGNTNVFSIANVSSVNSGNYDVVVTTPYGLSVTSDVAFLYVTNPPVPPTITTQPTNATVYFGQTASFSIAAVGPLTLSYQWYHNSTLMDGATDTTLTIANVQNDNDTVGTYRCDVSNVYGTIPSSNAVLTAIAPPAVTIGYLRTLVDPVFFLPTNTTALYTVTGIVTTHTNLTTTGNSSFYIQDATGGLDVFFGANPSAQPEAGDSVTVTGPLGQFNSLLELNLNSLDPSHLVVTNSHGNPLPPGVVLPFSFTNSPAFGGAGGAIRQFQGSVVTFTNVFFPDGIGGTNVFAGGANYVMTNQEGESFAFRCDARVFDIIGQPIPAFAWSVSGPMSFFLGATVADRSAGFQILPTSYADIVTTPPVPAIGNISVVDGKPTLTWTAQPYTSYSVYSAADVTGPYLPLVTGLTFNTLDGHFTDASAGASTRFYQIASP